MGDEEVCIEAAVALARRLVDAAAALDAQAPRRDRARRRRLRALVNDEAAAAFTVALTDEVTRPPVASRAARRFADLVRSAPLGAFAWTDRTLLAVGGRLAPVAPRLVMPLVTRRLRQESSGVILPAEDPAFAAHLAARQEAGVRTNVNVLGEAIVGEDEARQRLEMVLERLRRPDVDYVSVKISSICPSVSALAFEDTVERVAERLRLLYRQAAAADPPKFVNLDMEEYRDLALTMAVFRTVLDEPEHLGLDAGIALQAYLPDVQGAARELADWATQRRARGGGRIKVRVVKGANLAMETVEAELRGWALAPYPTKADTDASYKAVLDLLCDPAYDAAVRVGVASHNLFDVAWALGLKADLAAAGRPDRLELEMLEGMAPSQSEAVRRQAGALLLYAPVVAREDFPAAIAYLVRRLDENTAPENFLAHLFDLSSDRALFAAEAARFREATRARSTVSTTARRQQDRSAPVPPTAVGTPFVNAPDTDWTRPRNRHWVDEHLAAVDPAEPPVPTGTVAAVDDAVAAAGGAGPAWAALGGQRRGEVLNAVGDCFEANRGRVLATMAVDAAKTVFEGDPEVSEGIDLARYYARAAVALGAVRGAHPAPLGTVVVAPPWNFPFAIPAGGVLAALAAGNAVILKPAPQSRRTAALIAELCWEAGVPRAVLQFLPLADDDAGRRAITHPDVAAVILTGAHATAQQFLEWRPDLRLHAETSGKNAIVITATADVDHAVADLVRSAFGHAGQKCSAASLAIVEAPLYDDPAFLERLRDATATLAVGAPSDRATDVGPLIGPPGPDLERALTRLDAGETWLLAPECRSEDRCLWSPGIRLGVQPGAWFARTECFGPVLGIIRAHDLADAIAIQNSTAFGLTAGLHALDPREIARWEDAVEAGNLYVNRVITGAIVQRQPFGGWKRSSVGPTAKAGGPNYVPTLCRWADEPALDLGSVTAGYERWMQAVGRAEHDATGLRAERNVLRYRPLPGGVVVRFGAVADERERALVRLAAAATGTRLEVSEATDESAEALAARLRGLGVDRLRLVGAGPGDDPALAVRRAAHAAGITVDDAGPVSAPEVELPRWLREQAVSTTMHRHGRVAPPP